jgi:hypothetical protein
MGPHQERDKGDEVKALTAEQLKELDNWLNQPLEGLLYDLDLLPEQIKNTQDEMRMRAISRMHERGFNLSLLECKPATFPTHDNDGQTE